MTALHAGKFPNNPAGTEIIFRISTSLHLPNIQFVVYYWVPRTTTTILSLGIQGWNHHKFMVFTCHGSQIASVNREPSVKPEEPFFSVGEQMQNHKQFLERNRHELALQKLRNVSLSGFHCKLEKPIRGCDRCDLKVIEKEWCFPNMRPQFQMGFKSNSALSRYSFRSSFVALIPKDWGRNEDHMWKKTWRQ